MIGNDVVDLGDRDCRPGALHPRWDGRVFSPLERSFLESGVDRRLWRWRLWAAKEAAYKAACLRDAATPFRPAELEVSFAGPDQGFVEGADGRIPFAIRQDGDRVHAVATRAPADGARILSKVAPIGAEEPSAAVRGLAVALLVEHFGAGDWTFPRIGRRPGVARDGALHPAEVSFSHHGRFAACAILTGDTP